MKANPLACALLVLLAAAVQSPAQQPTANAAGTNASDWKPISSSGTNGLASKNTDLICVTNPDGSKVTISADPETETDVGESFCEKGDYVEAVRLFRKAAEQGDANAEYKLIFRYKRGEGVPQDYVEAAKWFRKAAEQGNVGAQFCLGAAYDDGEGVSQDYAEAAKWYRKAAEQGDAHAQYNLGIMYSNGQGVPQNHAEADKWYRRAADQGHVDAEFNLGVAYHNGNGVPRDEVEEYKWFNLAAAQGDETAKKNLLSLEAIMTPDQIAQAQELSREFTPRAESGSDNSTSPNNPTASGTGFFITDDGYLISNYHVVKDAAQVRVVTSSGTVPARVVQVDTANDIALLKVDIPAPPAGYVLEHGFPALPIAPSRTVSLGDTVATVGFPDPGLQGFSPKLAKGEIAALAGAMDDPNYFQISVPVQPGNSGGALVDAHGNVVGIVSAKLDAATALAASGALPENVNYAVKSSLLLSFLESAPDVDAKLKAPNTADEKFEDVVKSAQNAAVLVVVY